MKIFINWPTGGNLPVQVEGTDTVRELISLLGFSLAPNQMITLFYNGAILLESQTLFSAHINENSQLEASFQRAPTIALDECDTNSDSELDFQMDGVFLEQMRLNDLQMMAYESKKQVISPLSDTSEDEDFFGGDEPEQDTVIIPSKEICDKPLPILWNNYTYLMDMETEDNFTPTQTLYQVNGYPSLISGQKKQFMTF